MDLKELTKQNVSKLGTKPSRGSMALGVLKKGKTIRLNGAGGFVVVNNKEENNGKDNRNQVK